MISNMINNNCINIGDEPLTITITEPLQGEFIETSEPFLDINVKGIVTGPISSVRLMGARMENRYNFFATGYVSRSEFSIPIRLIGSSVYRIMVYDSGVFARVSFLFDQSKLTSNYSCHIMYCSES